MAGTRIVRWIGMLATLVVLPGPVCAAPAAWFPDPPTTPRYQWPAQPACPDCRALTVASTWRTMAALAGVPQAHFLFDPHDTQAAHAAPPDTLVIGSALLRRNRCEQAFVIGHELAHLARRHHDEDAHLVQVLSQRRGGWTMRGAQALQLLDGDFGLALELSTHWQRQEHEADWLGSLLAAQASGCILESGAGAFLHDSDDSPGLNASHAENAQRLAELLPFRESARRLTEFAPKYPR